MGWFKVTAPTGLPVHLNSEHCIRVRPNKGGDQDARAKAVIDLASGQQAVTETHDEVMALIDTAR
jgi:hypothetical protein